MQQYSTLACFNKKIMQAHLQCTGQISLWWWHIWLSQTHAKDQSLHRIHQGGSVCRLRWHSDFQRHIWWFAVASNSLQYLAKKMGLYINTAKTETVHWTWRWLFRWHQACKCQNVQVPWQLCNFRLLHDRNLQLVSKQHHPHLDVYVKECLTRMTYRSSIQPMSYGTGYIWKWNLDIISLQSQTASYNSATPSQCNHEYQMGSLCQ